MTASRPAPLERTLPHSLDYERAILGAVLVNPDAVFLITGLRDHHFFRPIHQWIWEAVLGLVERNITPDVLTLRDELERAKKIEEVGGIAYLTSLVDGMGRSANVEHYAASITRLWQLRQLIAVGSRMVAEAYEGADDPATVLEDAQRDLLALHDDEKRGAITAEQGIAEVMPLIEQILTTKSAVFGLATGFRDLDEHTRGVRPKELVIIAGRPSMGKTSLVGNVAERVAGRGDTVAFFSLEMGRQDVLLRMVCSNAQVDFHRFMSGIVADRDVRRISEAAAQISQFSLHIDDLAQATLLDLRATCRRIRMRQGLALVIVDYLQLMHGNQRAENRNLEMAGISRGLKALAKDLDVPVLALSQLSREAAKRSEHRPVLSDLRDSGALEQDADQVWFVHRPEVYEPTADNRGLAEIIIAKSRNGPTGIVKLMFRKEEMRFEDLQPEPAADRRLW